MRHAVMFAALSTLGILAGVGLAVFGVPYTRVDERAFAELYHGTEDTSGTVHVALDCDTTAPGTQNHCNFFASGFSMGVTVGNSTGFDLNIGSFDFVVVNNRQDLFNPAVGVDTNWDSNPDFNQTAAAGSQWMCSPAPVRDGDPSPNVSASEIHCFSFAQSAAIPLLDQSEHVRIASVHYSGAGPIGPEQQATFTLEEVFLFDEVFAEIMTCNPVVTVSGPCFGATANWGLPPPPTFPPTPTATPTALPTPVDYDGDGLPNDEDNCSNVPNPDQINSDGNVISNSPVFAQIDITRPHSDEEGDACDGDFGNDGMPDFRELDIAPGDFDHDFWCPAATGDSDPLIADTDGDRVLDGPECALGADPTNAGSRPALADCGPANDVDLDGLSARIEVCYYNTDPNAADTDGDGVKDGCEAASFNNDNIVNVADLGMLASEVSRVPPPAKLVNLDVNKDGVHNVADLGMVAARVGKCP